MRKISYELSENDAKYKFILIYRFAHYHKILLLSLLLSIRYKCVHNWNNKCYCFFYRKIIQRKKIEKKIRRQ